MIMKIFSTTSRVRPTAPLYLFLIFAFAACGDANLFQSPGADDAAAPEITAVEIASTRVTEGEELQLQVTGEGSRSLDQITIDFTGGVTGDTVIGLEDNIREVSQLIEWPVPQGTSDSTLSLSISLIDASGEAGSLDTAVVVLDATTPVITSTSAEPSVVGSGEEIVISVGASDARGVASVTAQVTSPTGYDTTLVETLTTPATTHSTTFVLEAPDLVITTLTVDVSATDVNALTGAAAETIELSLTDKTAPTISAFTVEGSSTTITVALRDTLTVEAAVSDRSGITRVAFFGETVVGDPDLFEDSLVSRYDRKTVEFPRPLQDTLPKDTVVATLLSSEDVTTKGPTLIYVEAEDSLGNIATATFEVVVGGPLVRITSPSEAESPVAAALNEDQSFTVEVFDTAGIDSAFLVLTGAVDSTISLTLPGTTTDTFTVTQAVAMPTAGGSVFAQAQAWSEQEVLGLSGIREIEVQDIRGPDMLEIRVNDSNTSGGPTVPLGDSIKVEVDLDDPSGITEVTFVGLALVGDSVLFEDSVITRFDERGVTFPRAFEDTLPNTLTVRRRLGSQDSDTRGEVRIVVTAEDDIGNTSEGTFDITVGGPSVVITDPGQDSIIPLGFDLPVTTRFFDPSGVTSATIEVTGDIEATLDTTFSGTPTDTFTATTLIPTSNDPGTFRVMVKALNSAGIEGRSDTLEFEMQDQEAPLLTDMTVQGEPEDTDNLLTIPLGDSVNVGIDVFDPSGVTAMTFEALALVGDTTVFQDSLLERFDPQTITFPRPLQDTLAKDTTVTVRLTSSDSTTFGMVRIFVTAVDSLGNSSRETYDIFVGGPSVRITYPREDTTGLGVNDTLIFRVTAYDPTGLDSIWLNQTTGGVTTAIVLKDGTIITDDTLEFSDTLFMPASEAQITLQAGARNLRPITGNTSEKVLEVSFDPPPDTLAPLVSVRVSPAFDGFDPTRMEFTDTFSISVVSFDDGQAGLKRHGFTAYLIRNDAIIDSLTSSTSPGADTTFAAAKGEKDTLTYSVPLDSIYFLMDSIFTFASDSGAAALDSITPDTIRWEIHAFAVDDEGNVSCSTTSREASVLCEEVADTLNDPFVADTTALRTRIIATRGKTIFLDNRDATIADLALDTLDGRLYLSNITQNLVELLEIHPHPDSLTFSEQIQVGSRPWGLFIGERVLTSSDIGFTGFGLVGDTVRTLIVANSGGTNMSLVNLDTTYGSVQEVDSVRVFTTNSVLWQYDVLDDDAGNSFYSGRDLIDFSDRPQFLAQDSLYRIVYSTVSTESAPENTVRFVVQDPDPTSDLDEPEMMFFLNEEMVDDEAVASVVLGNIDFAHVKPNDDSPDSVLLCTHEPGYLDAQICNGTRDPNAELIATYVANFSVAADLVQAQLNAVFDERGNNDGIVDPDERLAASLYYPFVVRGDWDLGDIDMADTTFVSASTNRGKIAVGEGFEGPTGRIFIWEGSAVPTFSAWAEYTDLVNNASERILGLGLNYNGSLGVARGEFTSFFFTPDLRLQGVVDNGAAGGAGAVFHVDHDSIFDGGHQDVAAGDFSGSAFTGTPVNSVEVYNTFHFDKITELFIRDVIVGPLRAGPPLAGEDNGGFGRTCPNAVVLDEDDCVVQKLYGITDTGGVVVINVRVRDLKQ